MRMHKMDCGVWVSWEKGSNQRKIEIHAPLGTDSKTHYVSIEDVGDEEAYVKWNAGTKGVATKLEAEGLREMARELLLMADVIDTRYGVPLPKNPLEEDPLAKEFFSVFDSKTK